MSENDKNVPAIVCDFHTKLISVTIIYTQKNMHLTIKIKITSVRGTYLVFSKEEISRFHI